MSESVESSAASPFKITLSEPQQIRLLDKLEVFAIRGHDKRRRRVLCVVGKLYPGRLVSCEALKHYLEMRIYPKLKESPFVVVYVHTGVRWTENCPGVFAFRWIYDGASVDVKRNLEAVYFVHPSIQTRLFLATFGRLMFDGRFYSKVKYINRLEFLWEHMRRQEIGEMPEFVTEHDKELEDSHGTTMDYGLESDHPRIHRSMDSVVSSYSMRCIA